MKMIICVVLLLVLIAFIGIIYLQRPEFGKKPNEHRLNRIKNSPNYKDGKFKNLKDVSMLPKGYTMIGEIYRTFFLKNEHKFPIDVIPHTKTDLKKIPIEENILIWFGHSSYYLQIDGKRILVDPVLMGSASPLPFGVKAFKGTDPYAPDEFPEIDYLLITHDHFDHLDYKTIKTLNNKIKTVICGLGVGETFEYWGFDSKQLLEFDWDELAIEIADFKIYTTTAQHGSGRVKNTDQTLWMSYIIETPSLNIYVGGDSGYNTHFSAIGEKFGPFDLAILDNGQYGEDWYSSIHMPPKFALQAALDLKAKRLFPVHSSKFVLSRHAWNEPLIKISNLNKEINIPLVTPIIGETVYLDDNTQTFKNWWEGIN